jgi:hypothetical protein
VHRSSVRTVTSTSSGACGGTFAPLETMSADERAQAIDQAPWFYKKLSREASDRILESAATGNFLVRTSSSQPGKILCVRGFNKPLNYIIFQSNSSGAWCVCPEARAECSRVSALGLYTLGKSESGFQGFASEIALIDYYFFNPLPHSDGGPLTLSAGVVV